MKTGQTKPALVSLVGAGPGDPGLVTLKGLERIREAAVIIYDRLVPEELLSRADGKAELIYVGKQPGGHTLAQEEINALMVAKAAAGLTVTRLKGGDPFVFGRGGEEAEALVAAGIPFEIVPGVTSAIAAPAYAGIPVTHRGLAASFTVVTGHEDPTKEKSDLDWSTLAADPGTLLFMMGMGNLAAITARLMAAGKDPRTPVALVQEGTGPDQRVLQANLADVAERALEQGFSAPAVIVIGSVAALGHKLAWFARGPLAHKRIVVSRPREQAGALAQRLSELGALPLLYPTIAIRPPLRHEALDRCLNSLSSYHWVIFTSVNGVDFFFRRLRERGGDVRELAGVRLGAIGPKTAEALAVRGLQVDLVPREFRAEALQAALAALVREGDRILLPRADIARPYLAEALQEIGAVVDSVSCYRTVPGEGDVRRLKKTLAAGGVDMITFTSSSTVHNLVSMLSLNEVMDGADRSSGDNLPESPGGGSGLTGIVQDLLRGVALAAIGPVTAETLRSYGLQVTAEASNYTVDGLIEAILSYYNSFGSSKQ